jgi:AAA domain
MALEFRKASRKQVKMKLAIAGPSGAGKTASSLLIAYGLAGDWSKVGVIDTENGSSELYFNQRFGDTKIGEYVIYDMKPPYKPELFIEVLLAMAETGVEVIVIDSLSHEWIGRGGILDEYNKMGGKFSDWAVLTPRHDRLIDTIRHLPVHVIATMRSKQEYAQAETNGKKKVEKLGMASQQRDGMDFEFTTVLQMNMQNFAETDKDRTHMFPVDQIFQPTAETGKKILEWCKLGIELEPEKKASVAEAKPQPTLGLEEVQNLITACTSEDKLKALFAEHKAVVGVREAIVERQKALKEQSAAQ